MYKLKTKNLKLYEFKIKKYNNEGMIAMITNELINKNSGVEVNVKEANKIKMSFELREDSYTKDESDGEVTFEGFKLIISKKECNKATVKYITNALKVDGIYNEVEITQDKNFVEFEVWIYDGHDWCSSVSQLEKSLYNTKEKMQAMLKIFEIGSFELIGLFYYAPTFD